MRSSSRFSVMAPPAVRFLGAAFLILGCAGVEATDPDGGGGPDVSVASVHVAPDPATVTVGQTLALSATARDAAGAVLAGRSFAWSSTNPGVAGVSGSGIVTAHAPGSATIAAVSDGIRGEVAVSVSPVPVASVELTPGSLSGTVGDTRTLTATVRDAAGAALTGRAIAWSSSSSAVAGVSASGATSATVTANGAGSATITASVEGASASVNATFAAAPPPPPPPPAAVATVALSPATATLLVGGTQTLTPTLRDASGNVLTGRSITWSSSNSGAATVSSGIVTAVAAGNATITATSEGRSGTASITVTEPSSSVVDTIFRETFESGTLSQWQDGVDARQRVITDASLARSGTRLLEVTYEQGGEGGFMTRFFMPGYDSVYVSYWVRFPATWQGSTKLIGIYGSRIDNQWSAFGRAGTRPNGTDFAIAFLVTEPGGTPGNTRFYTYFPDMFPDNGTYWGDLGIGRATYHAPLAMTLGSWHKIELWVKLNTPGQSNGLQRFWIDGVLKGEWTGLRFRDTNDIRLNSVQLTFNRAASISLAAQRLHIDDLQVLTARPSP